MLQLLSGSQRTVDALGFLLAFALTALMDSVFREKLPHDHGRAFAVNGELSKGKARGSGLIFVLCIALVTLAVVPLRTEYIIYTVLLIASMLSGYFDDASEVAWNEYKKGLIDLVIAIVAGVTYLNFNSTTVNFLQWSFAIPYPLYLVLIVVLICPAGPEQRKLHERHVVHLEDVSARRGEGLHGIQHGRGLRAVEAYARLPAELKVQRDFHPPARGEAAHDLFESGLHVAGLRREFPLEVEKTAVDAADLPGLDHVAVVLLKTAEARHAAKRHIILLMDGS